MFDRIEAGTFIIAAALACKQIKISGLETKILKSELKYLKKMGVKMKIGKNEIKVLKSLNIKPVSIKTEPYPGFPTDLQAQIMVLMTKASGISKIKENIFENRFMHVSELNRLGANIKINNDLAIIEGASILRLSLIHI